MTDQFNEAFKDRLMKLVSSGVERATEEATCDVGLSEAEARAYASGLGHGCALMGTHILKGLLGEIPPLTELTELDRNGLTICFEVWRKRRAFEIRHATGRLASGLRRKPRREG